MVVPNTTTLPDFFSLMTATDTAPEITVDTESSASKLEISDLEVSYDESLILRDVSMTVPPHEVVSILGRNGVGKTTTLKAVMGIRVSEEDEIAGLDTSEMGMEAYPDFSKG